MSRKRISKSRPPSQAAQTDPPTRPAIVSPVVDFLCCGGISIVAVIGFFVYYFIDPGSELFSRGLKLRDILLLEVLINSPHFLASYRLLYRSRKQITQHPWASTYVPLVLLILIIYALATPGEIPGPSAASDGIVAVSGQEPVTTEFANGMIVELMTIIAVVLLPWHYTGQAWGMTASFAYIGGVRPDDVERRMIRCGYYALLVWHILWALRVTIANPDMYLLRVFNDLIPQLQLLYQIWTVVVLFTIPIGIAGFLRIRRRTGSAPPLRSYTPWIAIYLWYALIWAFPGMFVFLQIFHALQYLGFPIRAEVNQFSAGRPRRTSARVLRAVAYYLSLVIAGLIVFDLPLFANLWGDRDLVLAALISSFVNIHHYVIDGAIWKIRNPQVRQDLFAHLRTA